SSLRDWSSDVCSSDLMRSSSFSVPAPSLPPGAGRSPRRARDAILAGMAAVVYLVRDLVFVSKIHEAAARLGLEVERAADAADLYGAARDATLAIVHLRLP